MKLKRFLSLTLTLILFINLAAIHSISASAAAATLTVSSAQGAAGTNVKISVTVSANSGLAAATLDLKYDKTKLEVVSAVKGAALTGGYAEVNSDTANSKVRLVYIDFNEFNGSGSILDVVFKIKETVPGTIPLNLDVINFVDKGSKEMNPAVVNGSVTIPTLPQLNITHNNTVVQDIFYNKIGLFKNYKKQPVQLGYVLNIPASDIAKVVWSSDNRTIAVDQNGKCTPTVNKKCSAKITVTVTDKLSKTYQKTILVKYYKFNCQKDK